MPDDWRDALTLLADRSRAALQRHPWILDITDDPAIGPNSVRHFDQSLRSRRVAPDRASRTSSTSSSTVDEYVFGYCLQQRNNVQPDDTGIDPEMVAYVNGLLKTGDYPHLARAGRRPRTRERVGSDRSAPTRSNPLRAQSQPSARRYRSRPQGLDEALDERERGVGDLAPAVVDDERVPAALPSSRSRSRPCCASASCTKRSRSPTARCGPSRRR